MPHSNLQPGFPPAPGEHADGVHQATIAPVVLPGARPVSMLASRSERDAATQSDGSAMQRPPLPPFTEQSAAEKVRMAEDGWNTQDPEKVALAYTVDSLWRNRTTFIEGRDEIIRFLRQKWTRELDYRLIKELWAFSDNRIAVRFAYEWRNDSDHWFRSYGNENWEFAANGLMRRRIASINDLPITEEQRLFRWKGNIRPHDHAGLSDLGL